MPLTKTAERMKASLARIQASLDNSLKQLEKSEIRHRRHLEELDQLNSRADNLIRRIKARNPGSDSRP